ncbi:MAG: [Fe-Fe] hydrogenase large subunit C-terminal domain-containing protein [Evtepia gabavorous]
MERLSHPESSKLPQFTSCCPGWVACPHGISQLAGHLSTAKAPSRCLAPSPKAITPRSWARAPRISSASP